MLESVRGRTGKRSRSGFGTCCCRLRQSQAWGRKQYAKPWPGARVGVGGFVLSCLFFVFMTLWDGRVNWAAAERPCLSEYLCSGARGKARPKMQSKYTLLQGFNAKGQMLLDVDDEVKAVKGQDGCYGYVLTDDGSKDGLVRLQYSSGVDNDRALHELMSRVVYHDQTLLDFVMRPTYRS